LRPWPTKAFLAVLAAAAALTAASARADDRIRTKVGIGVDGKIVGVAEDGLVMEVARAKRTISFAEIQRVEAGDFPDLKRAEIAFAEAGEGKAKAFETAAKLYQGLLKGDVPQWLRVVVSWRMFGVYAESGRVAEALDSFLEMAKTSPALLAGLKLPNPVEGDHDANKAMLAKVEGAIAKAGAKPYAEPLMNFRVGLLLLEGKPEEVLPLLEPMLKSEDPQVRQGAMLRQIEILLATDKAAEAAEVLAGLQEALGADQPAELAYWRGRVYEKQGKFKPAALEYMRLPILYAAKDRTRTAEALWRAGQALEAAKAPREEAVSVYKEAVGSYAGTAGADRAKRELARLSAK
jgi:tetratricopeptide (TPR) repeat protein